MSQSRRYSGKRPQQKQRYQGSRSPRPYAKKPYYGKKRQASSHELTLTLIVIIIFALAAIGSRISSNGLPYIVGMVVLVVAASAAALFYGMYRKQRELRAIQLSGVDVMDGFVFEKYVAELLKNEGFSSVTLTEKYDLGIDVIANRDGERWGIQVKRNRGKTKAESVRAAVTALTHYKCTRAMVVSNSLFTGAARELAKSNNCVLIDRGRLGEWIVHYQHRS